MTTFATVRQRIRPANGNLPHRQPAAKEQFASLKAEVLGAAAQRQLAVLPRERDAEVE
jgi:hypothetical protein